MGDEPRESSLQRSADPQPAANKTAMWAALIVAWLGWLFDGMEMGLYSWAVPPALKELHQTTDNNLIQPYIGITVALFLLGMSLGGVVFGRLGDKIGRVKTMIATVLTYAVFTGLSGLAPNFELLALFRFLGALGLGGEWGLGVALVMETWPNSKRPLMAGLLGAAANVGFLAAALLTGWLAKHPVIFNMANWRIALMLGFVPALLTLVIRLFVRESERFEQVKEKGRQSRFSDLFSPELRHNSIIGILLSAVAVLGMWGVYQAWMQGWVEKLVSESMTGQAAELIKTEVGLARALVTRYNAVGSIVGSLFGGILAQTLGRRASYALFCVGAFISSLLLYLTTHAFGPQLLWLAMLGGVFSASFFGWLPLYLPELFPTHLRASGEGLTFNFGRVISAVGVLFTGVLGQALGGPAKACAIMSVIYLVGLVVVQFARETKGTELPE